MLSWDNQILAAVLSFEADRYAVQAECSGSNWQLQGNKLEGLEAATSELWSNSMDL